MLLLRNYFIYIKNMLHAIYKHSYMIYFDINLCIELGSLIKTIILYFHMSIILYIILNNNNI